MQCGFSASTLGLLWVDLNITWCSAHGGQHSIITFVIGQVAFPSELFKTNHFKRQGKSWKPCLLANKSQRWAQMHRGEENRFHHSQWNGNSKQEGMGLMAVTLYINHPICCFYLNILLFFHVFNFWYLPASHKGCYYTPTLCQFYVQAELSALDLIPMRNSYKGTVRLLHSTVITLHKLHLPLHDLSH